MSAPVLIEVDKLADLLRVGTDPVLADVRWNLGGPPGLPEFEAGHLPGAHWVDLESELTSPPGAGGRHPLPTPAVFQAAMRRIGVSAGRPVVAYDAATSQSAARLWWLLTDAGHGAVRVLDGGYAAWQAAGHRVETGAPRPVPAGDFVARPGRRAIVGAAEITATAPPLVDVRAAERYTGRSETIDPVAGHIPGAVNLPATGNQHADGRFLPPEAIRARFAEVPADPVLYCGSGVTAAQSLLALESAGLRGRIYPGSWSDWITDPTRPVATGPR